MFDWRTCKDRCTCKGSNAQNKLCQGQIWLYTQRWGNNNFVRIHHCLVTKCWHFDLVFGMGWILYCLWKPTSFDSWRLALFYSFDNKQHSGTRAAIRTYCPHAHPVTSKLQVSYPLCRLNLVSWSWPGWICMSSLFECFRFWSKTTM